MKIGKSILSLLAGISAISMFAGCGGGSGDLAGDVAVPGDGTVSRIMISSTTGTPSYYDGVWNVQSGTLTFAVQLAAYRGGPEIKVDFELYKSSDPTSWNDPTADLKTFTKVTDFKAGTPAEYTFAMAGRFMIRALYAGTNKEIDHTRIVVGEAFVPDPITSDSISMELYSEKNPSRAGTQVWITVTNNTNQTINDLAFQARVDPTSATPSIKVKFWYSEDKTLLEQTTEIQTGEQYTPGSTNVRRSWYVPGGFVGFGYDNIVFDTLNVGEIKPGATIDVIVWYEVPGNS